MALTDLWTGLFQINGETIAFVVNKGQEIDDIQLPVKELAYD